MPSTRTARPCSSGAPQRRRVLPGFGLSLGYTLAYLGLIVLIPLSAAFFKTAQLTWPEFVAIVTAPRVMASYKLTFGAALGAAGINAVFGLLVAWVLVRYPFPGKRLADALVDLPFALPTAVAGIALTGLFAPKGWFGALLEPLGLKVAFTPLGVLVALTFIGLPFVVRTVQPVLEELPRELEEAAATLGASRWQSFRRVIFPIVMPALLTGFALAFARGDRRVRLRDLHRRQHADDLGDNAAHHHHQARAIRLRGRHRDRRGDAGRVVRAAARHQRAAGMGTTPAGRIELMGARWRPA